MAHIAELIMSAITNEVTGLPTTGANVTRGRVSSTNLPASLSVDLGQEQVLKEGVMALQDVLLDALVVIQVAGPEGTTDTTLNQVAAEVYAAVMNDPTHGIGDVKSTRYLGRSVPVRSKSQGVISTQEMKFQVHYRHAYKSADSNLQN